MAVDFLSRRMTDRDVASTQGYAHHAVRQSGSAGCIHSCTRGEIVHAPEATESLNSRGRRQVRQLIALVSWPARNVVSVRNCGVLTSRYIEASAVRSV